MVGEQGFAGGVFLIDGEKEALIPLFQGGPVLVEFFEEVVEGGAGLDGPGGFGGAGEVFEDREEEDVDLHLRLSGLRMPMQGRLR